MMMAAYMYQKKIYRFKKEVYMKANWTKDDPEYLMFADFYKLCRDFFTPDVRTKANKEEYFRDLIDTADMICRKYENNDVLVRIVLGFLDAMDKKAKEMEQNND